MGYAATHGRVCPVTIPAVLFTEALSNFPICFNLVTLPSESFDADGSYPARSDGADRRFSGDEAGDTPWNVEVERHGIDNNPANGYSEIWAKCPLTSAAVDVTTYAWYNDPDASLPAADDADEGSEGVWDANYGGVWHLSESAGDTANNYLDSTANDNHGTGSSMSLTPVTGPAAGMIAADFDGSADTITVADSASISPTSDLTLSAWVKIDATGSFQRALSKDRSSGNHSTFYSQISNGNKFQVAACDTAQPDQSYNNYYGTCATSLSASTWYHTAYTRNSSYSAIGYLNGASDGNGLLGSTGFGSGTTLSKNIEDSTGVLRFGSLRFQSATYYFDGKLDEVRISKYVRSAAWLAAEYTVINSIASITPGTPGSPGGTETLNPPIFGGRVARRSSSVGKASFGGLAVRRA